MTNPPKDLILVRHGRADSNEMKEFIGNPDLEQFVTPELLARPAEHHPLTNEGNCQTRAVGKWAANHLIAVEDVEPELFFVSPLVRTEQSAGNIGLEIEKSHPKIKVLWKRDRNLREQQRGDIQGLDDTYNKKTKDPGGLVSPNDRLYRHAAGGESHYHAIERWNTFSHRRAAELAGKVSLIVTHGYFMGAVQLAIEHEDSSDPEAWEAFKRRDVANGNIVHYSSVEPETGEATDKIRWVRAVLPYQTDKGISFDWREINEQGQITSNDLLQVNERYQQLLPPIEEVRELAS